MNTRESDYWKNASVPVIQPEFLSSLIASSSDIALVVSPKGVVLSIIVNPLETSFANLDHWEGNLVTDFLTSESVPKFHSLLEDYSNGEPLRKAVELNHSDKDIWDFPIRYTFHPFADGKALIMLGRDLRPIAETQQQLVRTQMSLEQGYEARREFDTRYRLLLRSVRDAIVYVSVSDGKIKDLNEPAATILGGTRDNLLGAVFTQEFRDHRRDEFIESLVNTSISETTSGFSATSRRSKHPLIITPNVFRAAGERVLICRLDHQNDQTAQLDSLGVNLDALYKKGADAFVFTDAAGVISTCNDAFLDLLDAAHLVDVKGRSLADFLGRGQIDLSVLVENARRSGQMRLYSTKLTNEYGARTSVEMSVTYLDDRSEQGLGFVIRDTSRVDAMRKAPIQSTDESNRNVMELVGSASLKEIVSETTDVVEKMCIETAVNLTRNNRVAAAEMLGLSRQSLYVKLRKYGLLSRDGSDAE